MVNLKSFALGIVCMSLLAFNSSKIQDYLVTNSTCEALKLEGYCIYTDSYPVKKYRLIGVISSNDLPKEHSSQYTAVRNLFVMKVRQDYGQEADGIILKMCDGCPDKANVIKFDE